MIKYLYLDNKNKNKILFLLYISVLASYIIAGNYSTEDWDFVLSKDVGYSLYVFLVQYLSYISFAPLLFNIICFACGLYILSDKIKTIFIIPILINPFSILNTLDSYNKFSFIFLLVSILFSDKLLKIKYSIIIKFFLVIILGGIHPLYLSLIIFISENNKNILALVFISIFLFLLDIPYSVLEILSPDKLSLFQQLDDFTYLSDGNYKFIYYNAGLLLTSLNKIISVLIFPLFIYKKTNTLDIVLFFYSLFFYFGLFWNTYKSKLNINTYLVLVLTLLSYIYLVNNFSGNLAVFYRHFLPLAPFFIYLSVKKF